MKLTVASFVSLKHNIASLGIPVMLVGLMLLPASQAHAAELIASDAAEGDYFGFMLSQSGDTALIGAFRNDDAGSMSGSAYVFRNLDTASGTITENVKLTASDAAEGDLFGHNVSLSGDTALVGADGNDDAGSGSGSAYVFRNLDTASGTITENVKLTASDAAEGDVFGWSVSQSGNTALVGANGNDDAGSKSGSAYVFRNLDTASGTITENVKLTASDAAEGDRFGFSLSQSGNTAVVGAHGHNDAGSYSGSAYVFRNLDTASGTITENVKLTASDASLNYNFGYSVSQSGNTALVGAYGGSNAGAYVFRNLDTASGTVTEDAKLTASDFALHDHLGFSVSQSGNTALVGAFTDGDAGTNSGSAYVFRNIDTASGTITENVKLTASDAEAADRFGYSVSLDGDQFLIGAYAKSENSGKAYSGSVNSVTTLDEGSASRIISGISFVSQDDWVIGQSTNSNQVTLSAGDTGNVSASGNSVFIGQNAGSDDNTLILMGNLIAIDLNIGSILGNSGNTLQIENAATFDFTNIFLSSNNTLSIEGDYTLAADLLIFLDDTTLQAQIGEGLFDAITLGNFDNFLTSNFDGEYTNIQAVPEPTSFAMFGIALLGMSRRRRQR